MNWRKHLILKAVMPSCRCKKRFICWGFLPLSFLKFKLEINCIEETALLQISGRGNTKFLNITKKNSGLKNTPRLRKKRGKMKYFLYILENGFCMAMLVLICNVHGWLAPILPTSKIILFSFLTFQKPNVSSQNFYSVFSIQRW